jgi:hypothetical protein
LPLSLALSRGRRFEQTDLSGTEFDAATRLGCAVLYSATLDGRTQFPCPHPPPPTPPVPPPAIEFVDSIRVTYGSMDRCGTAQLSRAEAEARCALRTRCQWILDYGCDGSSWRVCDWIKNMDPDPHSSSCSRVIATEVDRVPQYVHSWDNVDQWGPG